MNLQNEGSVPGFDGNRYIQTQFWPTRDLFLAMTHFRLGQKQKAVAHRQTARELMKKSAWSKDDTMQSLRHEAEALIEAKAGESRKKP